MAQGAIGAGESAPDSAGRMVSTGGDEAPTSVTQGGPGSGELLDVGCRRPPAALARGR